MYKIVAFEGLPASGKTSVIAKFRELAKGKTHPLFIDRFFYSTMVYAILENREQDISDIEKFYQFIKQWDVLIVYLDTPISIVITRDNGRNKWKKYTFEELLKIKQLYEDLFKKYPLPILYLDGTKTIDNLAEMVKNEVYW